MKNLLITTAFVLAASSISQAASPILESPAAPASAGPIKADSIGSKNAKRSEKLEAKLAKLKADGAALTGDEKLAFDLHIGAAEIWLGVLKNLPSDFAGKKTKKVITKELTKAKDVVAKAKSQGFAFEQAKFDTVSAALKALEARLGEATPDDKIVVEGMLKYAKHYLGFVEANKGKGALVGAYMSMVEAYVGKVGKFIDKSKAKASPATAPVVPTSK
jgi:hypothetical protein